MRLPVARYRFNEGLRADPSLNLVAPVEVDPFDLLSDDLVISILEIVGGGFQRLARVQDAKDLIQALLVCRRFEKLAHHVRSLIWPLRSKAEGRSLLTFVGQNQFLVEKLRLLIGEEQEDKSHGLVSGDPRLLKLLPKEVEVVCLKEAKTIRDNPVSSIADTLLSLSGIRHFSTFHGTIEVLGAGPISEVRHVEMGTGSLSLAAIKNLLQRCPYLETLKTNVHRSLDEYDSSDEDVHTGPVEVAQCFINSKMLKTLEIDALGDLLSLDVQAPNLVRLAVDCAYLKLEAPALQELDLLVCSLRQPVTFVQPCRRCSILKLFGAYDCHPWDTWTVLVARILRQCPNLEQLSLTLEGTMPTPSVADFMSQLPQGLKMLDLDTLFRTNLRSSRPPPVLALSSLRDLRIGYINELQRPGSYTTLRSLCRSMPSLEKLEVARLNTARIPKEDTSKFLAGFRKDFDNIRDLRMG